MKPTLNSLTTWPTTTYQVNPATREHSYLGLMQNNLLAMIPALGGDASAVMALNIENVFDGESGAIYPQ